MGTGTTPRSIGGARSDAWHQPAPRRTKVGPARPGAVLPRTRPLQCEGEAVTCEALRSAAYAFDEQL
eukprot:10646629-Lingulodinium_polyedra.AAC.1